jgi:hypothetical protein
VEDESFGFRDVRESGHFDISVISESIDVNSSGGKRLGGAIISILG